MFDAVLLRFYDVFSAVLHDLPWFLLWFTAVSLCPYAFTIAFLWIWCSMCIVSLQPHAVLWRFDAVIYPFSPPSSQTAQRSLGGPPSSKRLAFPEETAKAQKPKKLRENFIILGLQRCRNAFWKLRKVLKNLQLQHGTQAETPGSYLLFSQREDS